MGIVRVENLKKHFKGVRAVDGVSFGVSEKSINAILGPNGAGKTTTLKCILGMVKPTEGDVEIFGVKNDPQRVLNRIAFVPEEKNLYPSFTAMDMIEYAKSITENFNPVRALELVEEFQIPKKEKIMTFSHGMKTQLYLALAFAQDAELMILDEPTWGLDPIIRNRVLEMMRCFAENRTILYSSHILSEVEKISDRVLIMVKGRIVFDGYLEKMRSDFRCVVIPAEITVPENIAVSISTRGNIKMVVVNGKENLNELDRITKGRMKVENMNLEDIFMIMVRGEKDVKM